jgi:DNA-binding transcriptional LysR family regulator
LTTGYALDAKFLLIPLLFVHQLDLNLLPVVRVLLEEESVTRAAERLHLSVSATSRALDRARRMFDDPLLVAHGRGVVPTQVAIELLPRLCQGLDALDPIFALPPTFDPAKLRRTLTIRAADVLVALIGPSLSAIVSAEAPGGVLKFETETDHDIADLRSGEVLLGIGSYSDLTPDLEQELLTAEPLVGVVRAGLLNQSNAVSLAEFAALDHVVVSRLGHRRNPIDKLLTEHGLRRHVVAVVPSLLTALNMVCFSGLCTIAPQRVIDQAMPPSLYQTFELPFPTPLVEVAQVWHQRYGTDAEHRWLRGCVQRATGQVVASGTSAN